MCVKSVEIMINDGQQFNYRMSVCNLATWEKTKGFLPRALSLSFSLVNVLSLTIYHTNYAIARLVCSLFYFFFFFFSHSRFIDCAQHEKRKRMTIITLYLLSLSKFVCEYTPVFFSRHTSNVLCSRSSLSASFYVHFILHILQVKEQSLSFSMDCWLIIGNTRLDHVRSKQLFMHWNNHFAGEFYFWSTGIMI